ncbi:hypothetical protein VTG60DRAFT_110 [Thermothelomyces hinnuleus]
MESPAPLVVLNKTSRARRCPSSGSLLICTARWKASEVPNPSILWYVVDRSTVRVVPACRCWRAWAAWWLPRACRPRWSADGATGAAASTAVPAQRRAMSREYMGGGLPDEARSAKKRDLPNANHAFHGSVLWGMLVANKHRQQDNDEPSRLEKTPRYSIIAQDNQFAKSSMFPNSSLLSSVCGKELYFGLRCKWAWPGTKTVSLESESEVAHIERVASNARYPAVWPGGWVAGTVKCPKGRPVSGTAYCHGRFGIRGSSTRLFVRMPAVQPGYIIVCGWKPSLFLHLSSVRACAGTLAPVSLFFLSFHLFALLFLSQKLMGLVLPSSAPQNPKLRPFESYRNTVRDTRVVRRSIT